MTIPFNRIEFVNDVARIPYSENREAELTIVDETFSGNNTIGNINTIICVVNQYDNFDTLLDRVHCTNIIGLGDGIIGIHTEDATLLGTPLNKDNMASCTLELVEAE